MQAQFFLWNQLTANDNFVNYHKIAQFSLLGDPEVTANLYCNFVFLYLEGSVISSIYLRKLLGHPVFNPALSDRIITIENIHLNTPHSLVLHSRPASLSDSTPITCLGTLCMGIMTWLDLSGSISPVQLSFFCLSLSLYVYLCVSVWFYYNYLLVKHSLHGNSDSTRLIRVYFFCPKFFFLSLCVYLSLCNSILWYFFVSLPFLVYVSPIIFLLFLSYVSLALYRLSLCLSLSLSVSLSVGLSLSLSVCPSRSLIEIDITFSVSFFSPSLPSSLFHYLPSLFTFSLYLSFP